ncbi:MAG TPA: hypothetical protein DEO83_02095 [Lachnospiraceae bacterium]|jgi:cell division protein FtsQ|nr:hypothetical protein [Eubacterium sp.]HBZ02591.1 hypothetical protein [Lachnospiraceae bacterium]
MKKLIVPGIILLIILSALLYASTFSIKKIIVNGCVLSSEEDVKASIEDNLIMDNTIVLYLQNKFDPIENIPFVTKLSFDYVDKNTVSVEVYEKSVAGCIEYMESFVYFDREGVVLETSKDRYANVPYIKGITVKSWELGEELPIENKKRFDSILTITQLIDKYSIDIEGIEFTLDGEIVLRHDNIEIELGEGDNLPIQLMNLSSILEELKGKSGVLYMKEFDSENSTASFKVR